MRLSILPLGPLGLAPADLEGLAGRIADLLGLETRILPEYPLDPAALDPARQQYHSNRLVDAIVRRDHPLTPATTDEAPPSPDSHVLALTAADLFAADREFVFGEATLGGPVAIVGLARLRSVEPVRFHRRLLTECLHEIGHLGGLPHCPDPRCAMHPSRVPADLDRKPPRFCSRCDSRFSSVVRG